MILASIWYSDDVKGEKILTSTDEVDEKLIRTKLIFVYCLAFLLNLDFLFFEQLYYIYLFIYLYFHRLSLFTPAVFPLFASEEKLNEFKILPAGRQVLGAEVNL